MSGKRKPILDNHTLDRVDAAQEQLRRGDKSAIAKALSLNVKTVQWAFTAPQLLSEELLNEILGHTERMITKRNI